MDKITHFPNGLTVRELKELLKDWPETNSFGDPTEVWFETDLDISNSNQINQVMPLNDGDIIFEIV